MAPTVTASPSTVPRVVGHRGRTSVTSATSVTPGVAPRPDPRAPDTAVTGEPGPARRRGVPLRATIALLGGSGVAALFALTSPGMPAPSAPDVPPLAAPAGVVGAGVPSALVAPAPAPVPVTPVPPPATSAAQGPVPVVGALFDSAAGSFADLFDNSGGDGLVQAAGRPQIVHNPAAPGQEAWRFSLPGGGQRSEVLPQGRGTQPHEGDEQYVRYSAILSDDFPTDTSTWQVILQWHHDSPNGSPPLALQVTRGQLMMVSGGDDMRPIGSISPGEPINLTMHVVFSQDPSESSVTVWRDGRPTGVTAWHPRAGTMSTRGAYLKMGMYRDPRIGQPGSIMVTDLKIGRDARGIGGLGPRPAGAA